MVVLVVGAVIWMSIFRSKRVLRKVLPILTAFSGLFLTFAIVSDYRFLNAVSSSNLDHGMNYCVVLVCYYFNLRHVVFHNSWVIKRVLFFALGLYIIVFSTVVRQGELGIVLEFLLVLLFLVLQTIRSFRLECSSVRMI
jgi:hypothetical protein